MGSDIGEAVKILIAKQAIQEMLARYSQGIDRCDLKRLKSVFWEDAQVDYGSGLENAWSWSDAVLAGLGKMNRTMHAIGNIIIELESPTAATGQTYCNAYHEYDTADGTIEMIVGGRYLDRFENRGGEWRILRRNYVMDWNQNRPSTAEWDKGIYAGLTRRGSRFPDDPYYHEMP